MIVCHELGEPAAASVLGPMHLRYRYCGEHHQLTRGRQIETPPERGRLSIGHHSPHGGARGQRRPANPVGRDPYTSKDVGSQPTCSVGGEPTRKMTATCHYLRSEFQGKFMY